MAEANPPAAAGLPGRPPADPSDAASQAVSTVPAVSGVQPPPPPAASPPAASPSADDPSVMSLVDHLAELRTRILRALLAVLAGGVIGFAYGDHIVAILAAPIPIDGPLFFTGIGDPFVIRVKIALIVGVVLGMPIILYQLWAFIAPGLTPGEQRAIRPWIPIALAFFVLGVGIAYAVLPAAAGFLLGFRTADLAPLLTASEYFSFVTTMFLAFGIVLEFPIVLFALSRVGIVTSQRLSASRRYAFLVIVIFAAVATPGGDLVSPLVLGTTMFVLYELTRLAIKRTGR
jgi:sec-independent protein translocase protein TatC